jgi:mRNA degradation ribonuclease J1/J2
MERARQAILDALASAEHVADRGNINTRIHDALATFVYQETHRRPMVLPLTVEV